MTEAEWLTCDDPHPMLQFLDGEVVFLVDQGTAENQERMRPHLLRVATPRKLYLFGCACCRRLWPLLNDERSRKGVEIAEQYVDGLASYEAWSAAASDALAARDALRPDSRDTGRTAVQVARSIAHVALIACRLHAREAADECATAAAWACLFATIAEAKRDQAGLLRDIFGNPFRPTDLAPSCRTPQVVQRARAAYDERRFDDLPQLADVLEEVGCTDADVLEHCRRPGDHVRGCWVVDLVLGKECPPRVRSADHEFDLL
jgi:hypothetical protein